MMFALITETRVELSAGGLMSESGNQSGGGPGHHRQSRQTRRTSTIAPSASTQDPWVPREGRRRSHQYQQQTNLQPTAYSLVPPRQGPSTSRSLSPIPQQQFSSAGATSTTLLQPQSRPAGTSRSLSPQPSRPQPSATGGVFFKTIQAQQRQKLLQTSSASGGGSKGKVDIGNVVLYLQGAVDAKESTLDEEVTQRHWKQRQRQEVLNQRYKQLKQEQEHLQKQTQQLQQQQQYLAYQHQQQVQQLQNQQQVQYRDLIAQQQKFLKTQQRRVPTSSWFTSNS